MNATSMVFSFQSMHTHSTNKKSFEKYLSTQKDQKTKKSLDIEEHGGQFHVVSTYTIFFIYVLYQQWFVFVYLI